MAIGATAMRNGFQKMMDLFGRRLMKQLALNAAASGNPMVIGVTAMRDGKMMVQSGPPPTKNHA